MSRRLRRRGRVAPLLPLVALIALAAVGLSGCARAGRGGGDRVDPAADSTTVTLLVRNENFADVDVTVVGYGMRSRLGVVPGNLSRDFALEEWVSREPELRIVATRLGRTTGSVDRSFSVRPGQTIEFTIGMELWNSTVVVR